MNLPGILIDRAGQRCDLDKLIFDLDSSVRQTYGRRERRFDQRRCEVPSCCISLLASLLILAAQRILCVIRRS